MNHLKEKNFYKRDFKKTKTEMKRKTETKMEMEIKLEKQNENNNEEIQFCYSNRKKVEITPYDSQNFKNPGVIVYFGSSSTEYEADISVKEKYAFVDSFFKDTNDLFDETYAFYIRDRHTKQYEKHVSKENIYSDLGVSSNSTGHDDQDKMDEIIKRQENTQIKKKILVIIDGCYFDYLGSQVFKKYMSQSKQLNITFLLCSYRYVDMRITRDTFDITVFSKIKYNTIHFKEEFFSAMKNNHFLSLVHYIENDKPLVINRTDRSFDHNPILFYYAVKENN